MVGLAALGLMSDVAAAQPVLCVVDDAQWLDPETTRALAFVARRLGADSVGLVFASREIVVELESVPELHRGDSSSADSRVLLDSVLLGHPDGTVRERLLAETRGNPLALIELPRALTLAEAGDRDRSPVVRFPLHADRGAATDARSNPSPARRDGCCFSLRPSRSAIPRALDAAAQLGLSIEAADPAEEAGLFQIRERCSFRHPLVRSAVYGAATPSERRGRTARSRRQPTRSSTRIARRGIAPSDPGTR